MNKNELLQKAYSKGLVDVIKEWVKEQKYVSVSSIQRAFSIGYIMSNAIFDELIKLNLIEEEPCFNKGHKVICYSNLVNTKIFLLDINKEITDALYKEFKDCDGVKVIGDNFAHFMNTHKEVECVVSPANSFGYMDGGFDKAITDYFGLELEKKVQDFIAERYLGEQPVGTSIMVNIPGTDKKLIHTPTMRLPSPIKDPLTIYHCMRSTLVMVIKNNIRSVVIPAFGGLTGRVPPNIVAKYMKAGYDQVKNYIKEDC